MKLSPDVDQYIAGLPDDRKKIISEVRKQLVTNFPPGFQEVISYGMPGYVVPLSIYPKGYHAAKETPLPFISFASQKSYVSIYHMGLYADENLLKWFTGKYLAHIGTKPDIGKSCIRFKKPELVPAEIIGELARKMTPQQWINLYEKSLKK